jgi:chemotaxis protein histidine kinase CheA
VYNLFAQARKTLATLKEPQPAHIVQASVNALFRATHTLKGMAGMLGFPSFSRSAHRMEDIFDLMRKGRLRSTDSLVETLCSLHAQGWHHRIALADGVRATYQWFLEHQATLRV